MDRPINLRGASLPAPRRRWTLAVRLAAGSAAALVFVLTFLRLVDFRSVYQRLEHISVGLALLCGLVFLGAFIVRALRWRCFLAPDRVGVLRVIAIYQVAIFINWLLPVRGGELVKSLLLRRLDAIPISRSLPTVTMDKAMDLLPAVGLLLLLPFVPVHLSRPLWVLLLTVLVFLGLGVFVLGLMLWRRPVALALLRGLTAPLPGGVRQHLE